jgi:hypothetical protein
VIDREQHGVAVGCGGAECAVGCEMRVQRKR